MLELGGATPANGAGDVVIDGTDAGFMTDVIEASQATPVVVQFTAPWCGPCRTLGPQLEAAVRKTGGKVRMVRINIDENPQIAGQLQVQSIPAVFGFSGGQPVDGFMGAQSPSQIDAFMQKLEQAGGGGGGGRDEQITAMLDAADQAVSEGATGEAAQVYAQILGVMPDNLRALTGLSRCYAASGDMERARETLAMVPEDKTDDPLVAQVRSMIDLSETAGDGDAAALAQAVEANPTDPQVRLDFAMALIGSGQNEQAIDHLLTLFQQDREWNQGAARENLFKLFEALGPTDPLTLKGRRRLSSLMFA